MTSQASNSVLFDPFDTLRPLLSFPREGPFVPFDSSCYSTLQFRPIIDPWPAVTFRHTKINCRKTTWIQFLQTSPIDPLFFRSEKTYISSLEQISRLYYVVAILRKEEIRPFSFRTRLDRILRAHVATNHQVARATIRQALGTHGIVYISATSVRGPLATCVYEPRTRCHICVLPRCALYVGQRRTREPP